MQTMTIKNLPSATFYAVSSSMVRLHLGLFLALVDKVFHLIAIAPLHRQRIGLK
jgi:hypothetical protein